jgi:hypothetical protein
MPLLPPESYLFDQEIPSFPILLNRHLITVFTKPATGPSLSQMNLVNTFIYHLCKSEH